MYTVRMTLMDPTPDFDHPIDLLEACHERIRRMCDLVVRIAEHLSATGVDEDARVAARNVIRYFDTAGANHHRDEEQDLFPALHHFVPSGELNATRALLARLRADHTKLDALWADMRRRLEWLAEDDANEIPVQHAEAFKAAYVAHIQVEEAELLPLARRVIGIDGLALLGRRMARRRGVQPSPAGRPRAAA